MIGFWNPFGNDAFACDLHSASMTLELTSKNGIECLNRNDDDDNNNKLTRYSE